jgi:adenosylcobinamide kinase/adenosylcobinamide-phosphate guanylyltransferase
MATTLVLGGARSGKTRYAQRKVEAAVASGARPLMIATASAGDAEMAERIARHQAERGPEWRTLETPLLIEEALLTLKPEDAAVVDCMTLWLSNLMAEGADWRAAGRRVCAALAATPAKVWVVSNEVGSGIVPMTSLGRSFRDAAGFLNQDLAQTCDTVVLVVAGLALALKGDP